MFANEFAAENQRVVKFLTTIAEYVPTAGIIDAKHAMQHDIIARGFVRPGMAIWTSAMNGDPVFCFAKGNTSKDGHFCFGLTKENVPWLTERFADLPDNLTRYRLIQTLETIFEKIPLWADLLTELKNGTRNELGHPCLYRAVSYPDVTAGRVFNDKALELTNRLVLQLKRPETNHGLIASYIRELELLNKSQLND